MLQELLRAEQKYIEHFFTSFDVGEAEELLKIFLNSTGTLFFTGVGKSGLIAEKLALTMVSMGVKSWFIPPTNALHGDLGIVSVGDLFVFLSKSGESDELIELLPFVRNKGAKPIAWVSSRGSRLEEGCDLTVHLPLERELCPFDLAPTTSDVLQLIFGNVMAVAMMQARGFKLDDYAKNHPAGKIGRRISLRVEDLMVKGEDIPTCRTEDTLISQLSELSNKRCGCLIVVNEKREVEGIFTDGDLRRALQEKGSDVLESRLGDLMTQKFAGVEPDTLAYEAMKTMEERGPITSMPVVRKKKVLGLIQLHHIIQSGL